MSTSIEAPDPPVKRVERHGQPLRLGQEDPHEPLISDVVLDLLPAIENMRPVVSPRVAEAAVLTAGQGPVDRPDIEAITTLARRGYVVVWDVRFPDAPNESRGHGPVGRPHCDLHVFVEATSAAVV